MYQPGDLIVYGGEGVCRVEAVGPLALSGMKSDNIPPYHSGSPPNMAITGESTAITNPVMTGRRAGSIGVRPTSRSRLATNTPMIPWTMVLASLYLGSLLVKNSFICFVPPLCF